MNQDRYRGACLCGAVQFSFSNPRFAADCVCQSCPRAHGASVVGWVGTKQERFSLDSGEGQLRWYASSEAAQRGFCSTCGTRLFFRSTKWPGEIHMALACINEPHDLKSSGLAFAEEFPPWTAVRADAS